ncbi:hypothetical protein [Streptomyces sp. NPDC005180]
MRLVGGHVQAQAAEAHGVAVDAAVVDSGVGADLRNEVRVNEDHL